MKHKVLTPTAGSIWTHSVGVGQRVFAGTTLLIAEVMKMEIPIEAPVDGEVTWLAPCGQTLEAGDHVATLDDAPAPAPP